MVLELPLEIQNWFFVENDIFGSRFFKLFKIFSIFFDVLLPCNMII